MISNISRVKKTFIHICSKCKKKKEISIKDVQISENNNQVLVSCPQCEDCKTIECITIAESEDKELSNEQSALMLLIISRQIAEMQVQNNNYWRLAR